MDHRLRRVDPGPTAGLPVVAGVPLAAHVALERPPPRTNGRVALHVEDRAAHAPSGRDVQRRARRPLPENRLLEVVVAGDIHDAVAALPAVRDAGRAGRLGPSRVQVGHGPMRGNRRRHPKRKGDDGTRGRSATVGRVQTVAPDVGGTETHDGERRCGRAAHGAATSGRAVFERNAIAIPLERHRCAAADARADGDRLSKPRLRRRRLGEKRRAGRRVELLGA